MKPIALRHRRAFWYADMEHCVATLRANTMVLAKECGVSTKEAAKALLLLYPWNFE